MRVTYMKGWKSVCVGENLDISSSKATLKGTFFVFFGETATFSGTDSNNALAKDHSIRHCVTFTWYVVTDDLSPYLKQLQQFINHAMAHYYLFCQQTFIINLLSLRIRRT